VQDGARRAWLVTSPTKKKYFFSVGIGRNWSDWVEISRNGGTKVRGGEPRMNSNGHEFRLAEKIFLFWLNELVPAFTRVNAAFTRAEEVRRSWVPDRQYEKMVLYHFPRRKLLMANRLILTRGVICLEKYHFGE